LKKISVQVKIGFLMILAVILLSATGYLAYRNISSIVSSINIDAKPELRLISIREISMSLEKAQNCIRIYSVTRDDQDLKPYYSIISNIDDKVGRLRLECMNDSQMIRQTDTVSRLIEENIVIWNKLLSLRNDQNVVDNLKQLADSLVADSENSRKPEKNILKRVFGRKDKNRIDEAGLINDLQAIEQQDSITKEKIKRRESQLATTSIEIKERFYDLMAKIEEETAGIIKAKASEADLLARKTYMWLAFFSVSGTLLAILVMFIIIRFVRKTHAYQVALKKSKDETEKLTKTKELFIANMSHEIRTPITAISGFTEQLLHEHFDENTSRTIRIIKSSSDHLAKIINDILDFSKLQNDKLTLEKVHFNTELLLNDLYLLFEKQALRNNTLLSYSLSPETPQILLGDPYRLKQIIINLLSNSIKFTRNGKVHFSMKGVTKSNGELELVIEVVDTGIGIEESKIKFIFEDFTQEEMSTTRKYGGTGLGLSIVKKLVDLQNGNIDCVSRKNHGTRITIHLPYLPGDEKLILKENPSPLYIPEEIRRLKILIVDDEEYNRLLFKMILDRWGVEHRIVVSGAEVLEQLKAGKFNMLFMDIRMPGIDGLKVTKIIRQEMKIAESVMPVICVSAIAVNEDWQKYRDAGMNAFLPKPFTEEMLLTTIISFVKNDSMILNPRSIDIEKTDSPVRDRINLDNLYHISGGDERFVKEMLLSFVKSNETGLVELQAALDSGQTRQVAETAHKMLPPCRHIGASDLCGTLKKIEDCVQNKSGNKMIESLVKDLVREFDIVRSLISDHISKIT
jgi:signal transduction histidine kinase/CheY-like chemotaxis protein/CHASE3 domain sensor protein